MSAMIATATAPAQRSWAQIAKSQSTTPNSSDAHLKPGARGSLICLCRGKVLEMLTHYGWLMVYGVVDHASVKDHEGHVYISKSDIEDGQELFPGDIVNFHLYVDEKGLGAERCSVEQRATAQFNPNAAEFVPKFKESTGLSMRADAIEFVPSVAWSPPPVAGVKNDKPLDTGRRDHVTDVFARLSQVFVSDDDDSDEDTESWSDESDDSSEDGLQEPRKMPPKAKRSPSPDGSTSAGTTSDSEGESSCDAFPVLARKPPWACGAAMTKFRAAPGLTLPPNFRPPPGLSLPWEQAEES